MADQDEKKADEEKGDHINLKVKDQVRVFAPSGLCFSCPPTPSSPFFLFSHKPRTVQRGIGGCESNLAPPLVTTC